MKYVFAALLFVMTAIFPAAAADGVKRGLELCSSMVIPSLFPLMFCTLLFMRTGFARILSRVFARPAAYLLKLPESAGFALFAAMCGGYPAGAAAVRELYCKGEISEKQAERLAYFAFSAGPAFVLGAVGGAIYKSSAVGFLLLGVLCISVLVLGLVLSAFSEKETAGYAQKTDEQYKDVFVASAADAAKTLLSVCIFVVLFAYLLSIIQALGADRMLEGLLEVIGFSENTAKALLPCIMEVSSGCIAASKSGFPLVAFALGFGGLSVHFQVFSVLHDIPVSKIKFIVIRLAQGIICALLTLLAAQFLPEEAAETLSADAHLSAMPSATGSACLIIMCLMAVVCLPQHLTKGEKKV